ncbi:MAG: hypothetical protein ACREUA_03580 [Burkholderiales bacterium]
MELIREPNEEFTLVLTQKELKTLTKRIILHAEDAPTAMLNLAYFLNEARYRAADGFRQPPGAWEPGAKHPRTG